MPEESVFGKLLPMPGKAGKLPETPFLRYFVIHVGFKRCDSVRGTITSIEATSMWLTEPLMLTIHRDGDHLKVLTH